MKEKIGIEKLLSLLNEYDNGWDYDDYYGPYQYGQDRDAYHLCKYQLVSKEYGFIKWLVENDKIDRDKGEGDFYYDKLSLIIEPYERLLMLLAIQDEPIRFLCEIIK